MSIKRRVKLQSAPLGSAAEVMREAASKRWLQAKPLTIDYTGENIDKLLAKCIENDMQELVVRVTGFDENYDPSQYQAIVRFNDVNRQWACAVCPDAYDALTAALWQASTMTAPDKNRRKNPRADKPRLLSPAPDRGLSASKGKAGTRSVKPLRRPR